MKYKKYALKFRDGKVVLRYIVDCAPTLHGCSKTNQMRAIAKIWGLDIPWVMARAWKVVKSRNLAEFPFTYTLEIRY